MSNTSTKQGRPAATPATEPLDQAQFGQVYQVMPNTSLSGLMTPIKEIAVDWEVLVQARSLPSGVAASPGQLYARVSYNMGAVSFAPKPIVLSSTTAYRFKVMSRWVAVQLAWEGFLSGNTAPISIAVGCCLGGLSDSPTDFYLPAWVVNNGALSDSGVIDGQNIYGILLRYVAFVAAMPSGGAGASQCYLQFFDSTSAPTAGAKPIWCRDVFTAAGQAVDFNDGSTPVLRYGTGLSWGLSSTPDTFTACAAGGQVRVQAKLGS